MIKSIALGAAIGVATALVVRQLGRRAAAAEGPGEEKNAPSPLAPLAPTKTAPPLSKSLDTSARLTVLATRKARS